MPPGLCHRAINKGCEFPRGRGHDWLAWGLESLQSDMPGAGDGSREENQRHSEQKGAGCVGQTPQMPPQPSHAPSRSLRRALGSLWRDFTQRRQTGLRSSRTL